MSSSFLGGLRGLRLRNNFRQHELTQLIGFSPNALKTKQEAAQEESNAQIIRDLLHSLDNGYLG